MKGLMKPQSQILHVVVVVVVFVSAVTSFPDGCEAFQYSLLHQQNLLAHAIGGRRTAILFGLGDADSSSSSPDVGVQVTLDDNDALQPNLLDEIGTLQEVASNDTSSSNAGIEELPFSSEPFENPDELVETPSLTTKPVRATLADTELKSNEVELTRRAWLQTGAFIFGSTVLGAANLLHKHATETSLPKPAINTQLDSVAGPMSPKVENLQGGGKLEPVNLTQVVAETNVNVTLKCPEACVSVDSKTFAKVRSPNVPSWLPSWLSPRPKVIKEISNAELLVAAIIAGSSIDLVRTSLLYPIQTVKTRIQTDVQNLTNTPPSIETRIFSLKDNVKKHINDGNLYAGIKPSLLVSVPATGVYYGVRDVTKRMLAMSAMNNVEIALFGALIADVVSLCFRTPADALTLRLQNLDENVGDWFGDSLKRLPSIIITDLPYLLSKISLNRLLIHGDISIDRYTEFAILTATIAAILTTPFDVARTRILVSRAAEETGGSDEGVLQTMRRITKEGDGGLANLFAGWFERALYLGLGRAWLEPIQLIGYVGIRDAVLLEWF